VLDWPYEWNLLFRIHAVRRPQIQGSRMAWTGQFCRSTLNCCQYLRVLGSAGLFTWFRGNCFYMGVKCLMRVWQSFLCRAYVQKDTNLMFSWIRMNVQKCDSANVYNGFQALMAISFDNVVFYPRCWCDRSDYGGGSNFLHASCASARKEVLFSKLCLSRCQR